MMRNASALLLLFAMFAGACSGDDRPAQHSPQPASPPPASGSDSSGLTKYVGVFTGSLIGVGEVEIDYRGCDGLVVVGGGTCVDLLLDGEFEMVDRLERGSIIDFSHDPSQGIIQVDQLRAAIGVVEAIDPMHAYFKLLGQTVYVTERVAVFGSTAQGGITDLNGLSVGDNVTVSGYFSNAGVIVATLVQRNDEPKPPLLRGTLTEASSGQFRVGDLQLDLSGAALAGFPGGVPLAGDTVLLLAEQQPQDGVLAVTELRNAGNEYQSTLQKDVTGFVTAVRSNADFDIGGLGFPSNGCDQCDLLDASGKQLTAGAFVRFTQVPNDVAHLSRDWTSGDTTALDGPIAAIDADAGSITVLGFTVQVTPATGITADLQPWIGSDTLELTDFAVGDFVAARGGVFGQTIVADRLSSAGLGTRIRMMNYDLADPAIVFLGRSIRTDPSTAVLICEGYSDYCDPADTAWLFENAAARVFMLIIDVEIVGSELRAARIEALYY